MKPGGAIGLAGCLVACSAPAPPRAADTSPLSPSRVRAICDAAPEGKVSNSLSMPDGSNEVLPENGEFIVISDPRGCECVLVLRAHVIRTKQFKCG
ncbi:MAG TPA: hypothetical protein VFU71_17310 [Burkholderiaceae bacterium]|nr:hypothetical protein [Burkholderiaceae bacterium]